MPRGVPNERRCAACNHNKRPLLDKDLVLGMSMREAAEKFGLTKDIMHRHSKHIDEALRRKILAQDIRDNEVAEQQAVAGVLNDERVEVQGGLKRVVKEIEEILGRAKEKNDDPLALASLKEMRNTLVDLAKVYGQLKTSLTINVALTDSPEWAELRQVLIDVFRDHPDAERTFVERAHKLGVTDGRRIA